MSESGGNGGRDCTEVAGRDHTSENLQTGDKAEAVQGAGAWRRAKLGPSGDGRREAWPSERQVGCTPPGRGSPLGPGLGAQWREAGGEGLQLPRAGVGGSGPHCRCAFDVARPVGPRKPELPSAARCINATQSSMRPQKMWARGPVAGLAGNQGAAFQPEMKGSLHPDSYRHTHSPFSAPREGFSAWGDSHFLFPVGGSVKRETGNPGSSLSLQVSTSFPCWVRAGPAHASGGNTEPRFVPSPLARQAPPHPCVEGPTGSATRITGYERETHTQRTHEPVQLPRCSTKGAASVPCCCRPQTSTRDLEVLQGFRTLLLTLS